MSAREEETKLYFEARDRAIARMVEGEEFRAESTHAFRGGILTVERTPEELPQNELLEQVAPESNIGFAFICGILAKVEAVKGKSYQASWMKRGDESVFACLARKFEIIDAKMHGNDLGESRTTNLADLVVYGIKEIARQATLHPEEFKAWIEEVRNLKVGDKHV